MLSKRELKKKCYLEFLEREIISVEMILNHIKKIELKKGLFEEDVLYKDYIEAILDLELSLASLCILLRKMCENQMIELDQDLRRDMNSIIHSNRFEYDEEIIVYSQKGREEVDLHRILEFSRSLL